MGKHATATEATSARYQDLKAMLEDRRREITDSIQGNRQEVASDHDAKERRPDPSRMETSGDNISLALWEMRAETVKRIDDALERLIKGTYGRCKECGDEIEYKRLTALPFAIRCKDCEEALENEKLRSRKKASVYL